MLKQRVLTASVLAAVFLFVLFCTPLPVFSATIGIILLLSAWEWTGLSGLKSMLWRCFYCVGLAVVALSAYLWTENFHDESALRQLFIAASIWWALALLWVQGYPSSAVLWGSRAMRLVMGVCVLVPAWIAMSYLRALPAGAWVVLLLVLLVTAADIGAYFSGRAWGRRKLASRVSPGKSWEGVVGGSALALCVAAAFNLAWGGNAWLSILAIAALTSWISVLGDLLESMVKRHCGLKDSGNLLPGHGGVMDRVDGMVAAAPVFGLALMSTPWGL